MDSIMLERLRLGVQAYVARELLEDARFVARNAQASFAEDLLGDMLAVRLTSYVMAEKTLEADPVVTMSVPSTWWQLLKHDHGPGWLVRCWPVQYRLFEQKVSVKEYRTYPNASIELPRDQWGEPVNVRMFNPGGTWRPAE